MSAKAQVRVGIAILVIAAVIGLGAIWFWALFGMSQSVSNAWMATGFLLTSGAVCLSGAERRD